eukprot:5363297-Amphidinium_carterae.1
MDYIGFSFCWYGVSWNPLHRIKCCQVSLLVWQARAGEPVWYPSFVGHELKLEVTSTLFCVISCSLRSSGF